MDPACSEPTSRSTIAEASTTSESAKVLQFVLGFLDGGQDVFVPHAG
jgi:hypothetical protein